METKEPYAMEEIHRIREKLYENEKGRSPEEKITHANKIAEDFIKRYHLENRWIRISSKTAAA